jgi:hypothetical protein
VHIPNEDEPQRLPRITTLMQGWKNDIKCNSTNRQVFLKIMVYGRFHVRTQTVMLSKNLSLIELNLWFEPLEQTQKESIVIFWVMVKMKATRSSETSPIRLHGVTTQEHDPTFSLPWESQITKTSKLRAEIVPMTS